MDRLVPTLVVLLALALVAAPATADPATVTIDTPSSAQAGETVTVSLNVTNTGENATGYLLNVSLPDGWSVTDRTDDGGRWQANDTEWVWLSVDPGASRQPSLELTVPGNATDGSADFTASVADNEGVRDIAIADVSVESGDSHGGSDDGGGDDGGSDDGGSDDGGSDDGGSDDGGSDDGGSDDGGSNGGSSDDSSDDGGSDDSSDDGGSNGGSSDDGSDDGSSDGGSDSGHGSADTDGSDDSTTGSTSTPTDDSADGSPTGTGGGDATPAGETPARTATDEPTGTSGLDGSDGQPRPATSNESGTLVGASSSSPTVPGGLAVGALLLLAVGVSLVTVRRRGLPEVDSTPAANDDSAAAGSPADGDVDSGAADAQAPTDTTGGTDRSALTTAFESAGVDVLDVRVTRNGYEIEYWTAATDEDSASEEVSTLVERYLTAIDEGVEPRRLDVTLIRNGEPFGTWHIREPWVHQLTDGDMSPEPFRQLVFKTVSRID